MSFEDEKRSRSIDLETHYKEPLGGIDVSIFLSSLTGFQLTYYRDARSATSSMTLTIPISTPVPSSSKMNRHIQKSGPRWPTPTIPRCPRRRSALGSSVSCGPSLSLASTNSSSSDILPSPSPRSVIPSLFQSIFVPLLKPVPREKIVPQLLTFPICKLWARYLPNVTFFGVSLNPGPFTVKEHVVITIMASVGGASAYAVSPVQSNRLYQPSFSDTVSALFRLTLLPSKKSSTIRIPPLSVSFGSSTRFTFGLFLTTSCPKQTNGC